MGDETRKNSARPNSGTAGRLDDLSFEGCDEGVADAIRRWRATLTPGQTITGRQHSISAGLRKYVDPELNRVLDEYKALPNLRELDGFVLSAAWSVAPPAERLVKSIDGETLFHLAVRRAHEWRDRISCTILGRERSPLQQEERLRRHFGLLDWDVPLDECLLVSDHCAPPSLGEIFAGHSTDWASHVRCLPGLQDLSLDAKYHRLCQTLDSIILVIDFCCGLRPDYSTATGPDAAEVSTAPVKEFCDLCWRSTERWAWKTRAASPSGDIPFGGIKLSGKYCHHHHTACKSSHATGKNREAKFRAEVALLGRLPLENPGRFGWIRSSERPLGARLVLFPSSFAPEDVRRAAYAMVNMKLRSRAEQILFLDSQGWTFEAIAEAVGITERAVGTNREKSKQDMKEASFIARSRGDEPIDGYLVHTVDQFDKHILQLGPQKYQELMDGKDTWNSELVKASEKRTRPARRVRR